ncbi:MAG: arginine--tRNA ligase [bacterium]|nr:arginine--tRNA ligase [bacterium]
MLREILKHEIAEAVKKLFGKEADFDVFFGDKFADYSSNVAMVSSFSNIMEAAGKIKEELLKSETVKNYCSKIEIAGPGFLNFFLKDDVFIKNIEDILKAKEKYGSNNSLEGKKIMVEYTDPNPFKEFHIGHLMSNTIGESIARILESSGAEVKRACYQGDVGLHVAKAIWAYFQDSKKDIKSLSVADFGSYYKEGNSAYENSEEAKKEIIALNQKIYSRADDNINKIYDAGRKTSLDYFETIYKKLGTKFDYYFFESETGKIGKEVVEKFLDKGVFEKNDGAVIFSEEKSGLHTRVFINSEGLPTYEAKELGLAKIKYDKYPYEESIVITGNEINDYFKVLLKAMEFVYPELARKTKHISHGMLRLPTGKMSSRTGDVLKAEDFIKNTEENVLLKISDRELNEKEKNDIAGKVALSAIKYSILKQSPGKDIIFDIAQSISFEGDSGPYLQYAYVRAKSVLKTAEEKGIRKKTSAENIKITALEKMLYQFPEIIEDAREKYAPNYICAYLVALSHAFNSYYEKFKIISDETESSYRVFLTEAVAITLKNGLYLLGISVPEKM